MVSRNRGKTIIVKSISKSTSQCPFTTFHVNSATFMKVNQRQSRRFDTQVASIFVNSEAVGQTKMSKIFLFVRAFFSLLICHLRKNKKNKRPVGTIWVKHKNIAKPRLNCCFLDFLRKVFHAMTRKK